MEKPVLNDELKDIKAFINKAKEKFSVDDMPKIKIIGCQCFTYDCKNCVIGHL